MSTQRHTGYNGNKIEYDELETAMTEKKHKKVTSIGILNMKLLNLHHKGTGDLHPHTLVQTLILALTV
jgi:hypothetical protein